MFTQSLVNTKSVETCACGSTDVRKAYLTSGGEVYGVRLTCASCKASETF